MVIIKCEPSHIMTNPSSSRGHIHITLVVDIDIGYSTLELASTIAFQFSLQILKISVGMTILDVRWWISARLKKFWDFASNVISHRAKKLCLPFRHSYCAQDDMVIWIMFGLGRTSEKGDRVFC